MPVAYVGDIPAERLQESLDTMNDLVWKTIGGRTARTSSSKIFLCIGRPVARPSPRTQEG